MPRHALILLFLLGILPAAWAAQNAAAPISSESQTANRLAAAAQVGGSPPAPAALGSIHGTVVGSDGAVYEGVRVTLAETAADGKAMPKRSETTDSDGEFTFAGVPAGAFKLTLSSQGFVTRTVQGTLGAGASYDAHEIVLSMAQTATEVKVSASSSTVALAEQQLHIEERQRVLGVIPNFYVTYDPNAPPLDAKQKYALAWKSNIDPATWVISGLFAGVEQAQNTFSGYGQGAQGYAKRFGANYADDFIGDLLGGAVLPALFKQDPRYFYKGTGTVRSRVLYALANAVVCKGDNGRWQFNYSGLMGSLGAGGISNLYYPANDRDGAGLTFENAGLGIAESAASNLFQEFVIKKLTPKAGKGASP